MELVIGLVGSTIGVAICIMFPAACFRKIIKKDSTERNLAQFIIISGFCLMILGTYANLSAIDEKSSGSHLDVQKIDEPALLIKPTEFVKESLDEKIKNIEKALEEKDKEKAEAEAEANKLVKNLKEIQEKENLNQTKIIKQEKPSPPPLPVDEPHPVEEKENIKETEIKPPKVLPPVKQEENEIIKKPAINLTEQRNILPNEKQIPEKKTTASVMEVQPQTIDNDAIKKDEEVAKEEYKQENEELKKTQKELEKTKDLLEKKVEELKEELVKQNQETQNLVVEKLGEVVEKFEAIERKVQQQKDEEPQQQQAKLPVDQNQELKKSDNLPPLTDNNVNDTNNFKPQKGSLISILTENRPLNKNNNNKPTLTEKVYEPLSYKTGELIENVQHNSSLFEKRLPLPLALLINASQAKLNDTAFIKPQIPLQQLKILENKAQPKLEPTPENIISNKDIDKINVEAIRREILELKPNPNEITTNVPDNENNIAAHRNKRSYQNLEVNGNCLTEPKVENLMASSHSSGLEMKIGRDLKSLRDEE